jgi:uncharacterized membrane protein YhiD involved in acid resistance
MDPLWRFLDGGLARNGVFTPQSAVLSLLVAFVLGQLLAWVYYATHTGLSYSRSFVQSLILMVVVVSLVMAVIGNSIITAFGLMGALALVRFRNVIRDTRDIAFVFCALVIGMAAGTQRYAVAVIGTVALCAIAIYLYLTSFGAHYSHNAFLRFRLPGGAARAQTVAAVLKRFCGAFALISVQEGETPGAAEYAYQLMLRDSSRNEEMLADLAQIAGIDDVNLTMQEELLEV